MASDTAVFVPFTFERGANTSDASSMVEVGEAQELVNWEWLRNGGITPRPAWKAAGVTPTGGPGDGDRVSRGIATNFYDNGVRKLTLATLVPAGHNFQLYETSVADPTAFTTYSTIGGTIAVDPTLEHLPAAFAIGAGHILVTHPGFPSAQMRKWDGTTLNLAGDVNIAGRAAVYYLSRFWIGGSPVNGSYLRYSEIADPDNWNLTENFIPLGKDDGEPIEDIVVWNDVLVVGKRHSLYYVYGDSPDSFGQRVISVEHGAAPGRSLTSTPQGVYVVGIDGSCYLWSGGDLRLVSPQYEIAMLPATGYMSSAHVGDKLYVTKSTGGTDLDVYDTLNQRWRHETTIGLGTTGPGEVVNYDDSYLIGGAVNGARLLSVRKEAGAFATGTYRDPGKDPGFDGQYAAVTGTVWPGEISAAALLKGVFVRYHQWAADSPGVTVTPIVNGVEQPSFAQGFGGQTGAGWYEERLDFGQLGMSFALRLDSTPVVAESATYSIEAMIGQLEVYPG